MAGRARIKFDRRGAGSYTDGGEFHDLETWDPRRDDYEDKKFNSYTRGLGSSLQMKRGKQGIQLFIIGIPNEIENEGLRNLFSRAGRVLYADKKQSKKEGSTETFGFVTMATKADAERAIRMFNDFGINRSVMKVRVAMTKEELKERNMQRQKYFYQNSDFDDELSGDDEIDGGYKSDAAIVHAKLDQKERATAAARTFLGKGRGQVLQVALSETFGDIPPQQPSALRLHPGGAAMRDDPGLLAITNPLAVKVEPEASVVARPPGAYPGPKSHTSRNKDYRDYASKQSGYMDTYNNQTGHSGYMESTPSIAMDTRRTGFERPGTRGMEGLDSSQQSLRSRMEEDPLLVTPVGRCTAQPSVPAAPAQRPVKAPSEPFMRQECSLCGNLGSLRCSQCKAPYCSQVCQKEDWTTHRNICLAMKKDQELSDAFTGQFDLTVGEELIPKVKDLMEKAAGPLEVQKKSRPSPRASLTKTPSPQPTVTSPHLQDTQSRTSMSPQQQNAADRQQKSPALQQARQADARSGQQQRSGSERGYPGKQDLTRMTLEMSPQQVPVVSPNNTQAMSQRGPEPHRNTLQDRPRGAQEATRTDPHSQKNFTNQPSNRATDKPLYTSETSKSLSNQSQYRGNMKAKPNNSDLPKPGQSYNDRRSLTNETAHIEISGSSTSNKLLSDMRRDVVSNQPEQQRSSNVPVSVSTPRQVASKKSVTPPPPPKKTIQSATMPMNEVIEVMVTEVKDPGCFYVQLLTQECIDHILAVTARLVEKYSPGTPCDVSSVLIGELYAGRFSEDQQWYRVQVIHIGDSGRAGGLTVKFVDFGNSEATSLSELRQLERDMQVIPAQAVLCGIEGVKPIGFDWNIQAAQLAEFLKPDVKYRAACRSVVTTDQGRLHLVDLSTENDEPVKQMLLSCGLVQTGSGKQRNQSGENESSDAIFRVRDLVQVSSKLQAGERNTCLVTDAQTPNDFGLQVINESFNMFSQKLQEVYNNSKTQPYRAKEEGEMVVCRYAGDGNWYRAEVKEMSAQGVGVVYVDFLNTECVPLERVRAAEKWCTDIPVQGIHCTLHGVKAPVDGNWPKETMSLMAEVGNNPVKATVKEIQGSSIAVELVTLSGVSVNDKMNQMLGLLDMADKPTVKTSKPAEISTKLANIQSNTAEISDKTKADVKAIPKPAEARIDKPPIVTKEPTTIEPGKLALDGSEAVVSVTSIAASDKLYIQKQDVELLESLRTIQVTLTNTCTEGGSFKASKGDYVAAKYTDNVWYRGLVLEDCRRDGSNYAVFFVDYGNTEIVEASKVAELEQKFCRLPCMAVRCQMKGTEKLSNEKLVNELQCLVNSQFTARSTACKDGVYAVELFTMDGNSVNELVLRTEGLQTGESSDPEVEQQQRALKIQIDMESMNKQDTQRPAAKAESRSSANELNKGSPTIPEDQGMKSNQQDVVDSIPNIQRTTQIVNDRCLPLDGTEVLSIVVYVERLDNFFIQPVKQEVQLKLVEIQQGLCQACEANQTVYKSAVGEFVAAKYTDADCTMWYRCKVLDVTSGKVQVFIVDYGNVDWVPVEDVRQLSELFLAEPAVAVRCQLKGSTGKEDAAIVNDFNAVKDTPVNVKAMQKLSDGSYVVDILLTDANATSVSGFLIEPTEQVGSQDKSPKETSKEDLSSESTVEAKSEPVVQETAQVKQESPVKVESLKPGMQLKTLDLPIGHPVSAAVFWVDDIRSFYIQQADETLLTEFSEMMADMLVHYGDISEVYSPRVGEVVAAFYNDGEQSLWYRSEVVKLSEKTCCVSFCDYGNSDSVLLKDIRKLDQKYTIQPSMAIHCGLAGEGAQTDKMLERLKLVMNIELKVIALSKDRDVYSVKLQSLDGATLNTDIGLTLHESAVCQSPSKSSEPLPLRVKTPPRGERKSFFIQTLSKCRPMTNKLKVMITSITSPQLFHCQELKDDLETLGELQLLTDAMKLQCETDSQQDGHYEVGELCCARFPVDDGDWYRCTILEFLADGSSARVEYVDFGNQETLPVSQIHPATDEYTHLPLLAFKCSLSGVSPVETAWTLDAVREMVKFQDRPLVAHVNSIHTDVYEMTVTDENGVDIGDSLVKAGLAKKL